MKAAWYTRTGPAGAVLQLGEMETPTPAAGEVLVRVHTSGVNPSDVKLRAGARAGGMPFPRIVPHSDGAGVVEAVGEGVDSQRIGERVWLWNAQWERPLGSAAAFIALPEAQAVRLPANTDFAAAACLGIPAMTAYRCVYADGSVTGQTVLVTGGAGTVARYAIQMAVLEGATVIATVSNPEKAAYAKTAGAHHIVNYREDDVAEAVLALTGGRGVDRIVDLEFGANLAASARMIRPNGVIATYGSAQVPQPALPFYELLFKDVTLRMVLVYRLTPAARAAAVNGLTRLMESGVLTHSVAERYPLADIAAAHERVERGDKLGSVVVDVY